MYNNLSNNNQLYNKNHENTFYLNPLTKGILLSLLAIAITFKFFNLLENLILLLFIIALFIFNKISLASVLSELKALKFLLIFAFIINIDINNSLLDNFTQLSLIVIRTTNIFLIAIFYIRTSSISDMIYFWEKVFIPFNLFKVNNKELAQIIVIAIRFVPILISELERIKIAQAARGITLNQVNFQKKIKAYISLIIPLMVIALQKAENLAIAMEARGYNFITPRSSYKIYSFTIYDILVSFFFLILLILFYLTKV